MSDLRKEFKNFGFDRKGVIILNKNKTLPILNCNSLETDEGIVYLWVIEEDDKPSKIVYIGKAGKTLAKRCAQHLNGFKINGGSKKGFSNGVQLLNLLKMDNKISIYARLSQRMQILGQPEISPM